MLLYYLLYFIILNHQFCIYGTKENSLYRETACYHIQSKFLMKSSPKENMDLTIIDGCFLSNNSVAILTEKSIHFFEDNSTKKPSFTLNIENILGLHHCSWKNVWANSQKKQLYVTTNAFNENNNNDQYKQYLVLLQYDIQNAHYMVKHKGYIENESLSFFFPQTGLACMWSCKNKNKAIANRLGSLSQDKDGLTFEEYYFNNNVIKYCDYNEKNQCCVLFIKKSNHQTTHKKTAYRIKLLSFKDKKMLWSNPIQKIMSCAFNNTHGEKIIYFDDTYIYAINTFSGNREAKSPISLWNTPPFNDWYPPATTEKPTHYNDDGSKKMIVSEDDRSLIVYQRTHEN